MLIVLDEVDYIGSSQLTNILNIRNEAPERIKVLAASTPCGKHEEFYKWCMGATRSYKPKQEDIDNFRFTGYDLYKAEDIGEKGNGWVQVYAPSVVNKELLKINPDTEQTYLQDIKDELSEIRYDQEVMANFGDEEMGVYQKKFINAAIGEGRRVKHRYLDLNDEKAVYEFLRNRRGPVVLGVDWDKYQAGTTMVGLYLDKDHRNAEGHVEPKFKTLFRIEIPRTEFTYVNAVNKIIELNDILDFDWIAVDRGYGETQIELLHQYGMANPQSGLATKVVGYQFGEKIEVRDPHTQKKDKKPLKPFMVNNSVVAFEKIKVVLDPTDKLLIEQLESYRVESISKTGLPVYSSENEHAVDALNLCLLIIEQKYGSLFRSVMSSKIARIKEMDIKGENVLSRSVSPNANIFVDEVASKKNVLVSIGGKSNNLRSFSSTSQFGSRMFKRSNF